MNVPFSPSDRQKLASELQHCFPDAVVDDRAITAYALTLWMTHAKSPIDLTPYAAAFEALARELGLTVTDTPTGPEFRAPLGEGAFRYYRVAANHDREIPDFQPFTGHLTMVRVSLPNTTRQTFSTPIGSVEPADHLLATVDEVRAKFGPAVGPIERVDLITPPRFGGARFGAISVLLGYRPGDGATPSFYVLEAGTATGNPKVLFLAATLETVIVSYSGYQPTPFAGPTHVYTGKLAVSGDSPDLLRITAHKDQSSMPYIRLTVKFEETQHPIAVWPGLQLAQAAAIVLWRELQGVKP